MCYIMLVTCVFMTCHVCPQPSDPQLLSFSIHIRQIPYAYQANLHAHVATITCYTFLTIHLHTLRFLQLTTLHV